MKRPKLLIIGHARHGKDTVAGFFETCGYKGESSSKKALDLFLYDKLQPQFGYKSKKEAFEDRVNHRALWANEIIAYNEGDPSRLAREIMATNDIYIGLRAYEEIKDSVDKGLFDLIIEVFDPRKELESEESYDHRCKEFADILIVNNAGIDELKNLCVALAELLYECPEMFVDETPEEDGYMFTFEAKDFTSDMFQDPEFVQ